MPTTPYLDGRSFDLETRRVMGVALEMARAALRLADRTDPITEMLVKRIILLAKEGLRDPNLLCEWALDDLHLSRGGRLAGRSEVPTLCAIDRGRDEPRVFQRRTFPARRQ